jgi:hypothetical protein
MTATISLTLEEILKYQQDCKNWARIREIRLANFWIKEIQAIPENLRSTSYENEQVMARLGDIEKEIEPFPALLTKI